MPEVLLAEVSIHAAREGGDGTCGCLCACFCRVSIHAAREGGDATAPMPRHWQHWFQSTPPVKAATMEEMQNSYAGLVSIHAAREGGDIREILFHDIIYVSIHAAREGGDGTNDEARRNGVVSIHAAREGGDYSGLPSQP